MSGPGARAPTEPPGARPNRAARRNRRRQKKARKRSKRPLCSLMRGLWLKWHLAAASPRGGHPTPPPTPLTPTPLGRGATNLNEPAARSVPRAARIRNRRRRKSPSVFCRIVARRSTQTCFSVRAFTQRRHETRERDDARATRTLRARANRSDLCNASAPLQPLRLTRDVSPETTYSRVMTLDTQKTRELCGADTLVEED